MANEPTEHTLRAQLLSYSKERSKRDSKYAHDVRKAFKERKEAQAKKQETK